MPLPADLLELLRCPADAGRLTEHADPPELRCERCGRRYPVEDGIPILLVSAADEPNAEAQP